MAKIGFVPSTEVPQVQAERVGYPGIPPKLASFLPVALVPAMPPNTSLEEGGSEIGFVPSTEVAQVQAGRVGYPGFPANWLRSCQSQLCRQAAEP
jgi:hypothetical protein